MQDRTDFVARARELGPSFARRAAEHDQAGTFVTENYADLKRAAFFGAGIPDALGGGGATHAELCLALRELARHCGSTALALSMHTHLVATTVYRHLQGAPVEAMLRNVAANQLCLVSTGAADWLQSNGEAQKVDGGYLVTASKIFASGSPVGDLMITSAPYDDPQEGPRVLHFAVPFSAPGVTVGQDWDTLGMRGTGSHTVRLEKVFVPEDKITLRRPRQGWHPMFSVICVVALPLIMSVYLGIADAACEVALGQAKRRAQEPQAPFLVGEMQNAHTMARLAWESAVANANGYAFKPELERANQTLTYKTLIATNVQATVEKAMEAAGGPGFFRRLGLERLFRDAQGGAYHPLPEKRQQLFSGRLALGLDPVVGI